MPIFDGLARIGSDQIAGANRAARRRNALRLLRPWSRMSQAAQLNFAVLLYDFRRLRFQDRICVIANILVRVAYAATPQPAGHWTGTRWQRLETGLAERMGPYAGEIRD